MILFYYNLGLTVLTKFISEIKMRPDTWAVGHNQTEFNKEKDFITRLLIPRLPKHSPQFTIFLHNEGVFKEV